MDKLFSSHSSQDDAFVRELRTALAAAPDLDFMMAAEILFLIETLEKRG